MIFSVIAFSLFMAVFISLNTFLSSAENLALAITLHRDAEAGIPEVDRNGNKWSWEQLRVLRAFAKALYEYATKGKPISIAVSAVAGSGKTSLLQGMTHIVAKLCPELLTAMTAFNTHIAASSKDILIQFQSTDGLNIKIFGGSNTVNAGGNQLLSTKAVGEGFHPLIDYQSYASDRYVRIARLTLAGWLGRDAEKTQHDSTVPLPHGERPAPTSRLGILERAMSAMGVKTTSHVFNNMIGEGLVKVCNMVMDEGFVPEQTARLERDSTGRVIGVSDDVSTDPYIPPTPHEDDVKAILEVISRVGKNQGWAENPARNLGDVAVCELVVEILAVAIETAFMKVELKPYCGEEKSFMDAIVPFKQSNRPGGFETWQPMKTVKKQIHTTDPATIKKAQFAILENGGCRFPPANAKGSNSTVKAVSFDTEAKVIVKKHKGHIIYSFENGGHLKKIGGKGFGTQFGKNGNAIVNGENINTWRRYDSSLGLGIVKPNCVEKVVALLTEKFGDEFHNMLEDADDVEIESTMTDGNKGQLILSMADQIYLPHALDLQIPEHEKADVMMIDEVQDLSVLKAQLVWRLVKEDAHKVIVGDLRQAIYLFAGASSQAFEDNAKAIDATFYPQTICWRGTDMVAQSVKYACESFATQARRYHADIDLPDYQAHRSPLEAGYDFWPVGAAPIQIEGDEIVKAYHKSRELHGEDATFGLLCRIKKPLATFLKVFLMNGIPVSTPATIKGGATGLVDEAFSVASKQRSGALDKPNSKVSSGTILGLGWHLLAANKVKQHSLLLRDIESLRKVALSKYSDLFKGDTKSMAQSTAFQEFMGNLELVEAFVSLHRSRNTDGEIKGKNLADALKNWVNDTLFSERGGNAVHIATIHRYKGDEADIMFIVNSVVEDDEDGNPTVQSCFMNKRACEASAESAVNEVSMGYVAYSRAKKQNIIINGELEGQVAQDVEQRLQGAYDLDMDMMCNDIPTEVKESPQDTPESDSGADADLDRCVECSTIIAEGEEHGVCCKCNGHLCRVRYDTHSKSGKFKKHMGGEIAPNSCGSVLVNISLDEMINNNAEELESKRVCSSCEGGDEDRGDDDGNDDDGHDWTTETEYVELETVEGKVVAMNMEDFDAWEAQNPQYEGIQQARHMSEGEVQGFYFERVEAPSQAEEAPVLPEVIPTPILLMNRDVFKRDRKGDTHGALKHKLHIDANPDEPSGESLCGKQFNIHGTIAKPKSEWVGGIPGGNNSIPQIVDADSVIGVRRSYTVYTGWGYSARSHTRYAILNNVGTDGHYCRRCVKKWTDLHGMGVFEPTRGFAAPQHGLLHQLPLEVSFVDKKGKEDKPDYTMGVVDFKHPRIDKEGVSRYSSDETDLALFVLRDESLLIQTRQDWFLPLKESIGRSWGSKGWNEGRIYETSFQFEMEIQRMVMTGRLKFNEKGSLVIPFTDELLNDVDCTDLEGEVADFVGGFLRRYMVARCFEAHSPKRIAEQFPTATVFDKMFNRTVRLKNEEKDTWEDAVNPNRPHTLKEWEALPLKEDC